ncbi:MAG: hypothetical protein KDA90_21970 [Planctomycetaceae bacterium]|nr:hypothetical protein [Planctomycetaceae bacterium]
MEKTAIPPWTPTGVLPPVNDADPVGPDRSPYQVSLVDIVLRFATSRERRQILDGLLRFRRELHSTGLVEGFQWIDGSFLEAVETLERRAPKDVDVVTFVEPPADFAISDRVKAILNHDSVKRHYFVDHYFVELTLPSKNLVEQSTYWSSLWSHRRSMQWKGFLQINLDPSEDVAAAKNLEEAGNVETAE